MRLAFRRCIDCRNLSNLCKLVTFYKFIFIGDIKDTILSPIFIIGSPIKCDTKGNYLIFPESRGAIQILKTDDRRLTAESSKNSLRSHRRSYSIRRDNYDFRLCVLSLWDMRLFNLNYEEIKL
jgi:hypothetical protein